ncbi:MAG: hypothetical protein ABIT01_18950, partial [Thermoanaerobaculia bacterium]
MPNGFPGIPTYRLPAGTPLPVAGSRVVAPFGPKLLTGIVVGLDPPPAPATVEERELVAIVDDEPFLPASLVSVLLRAAEYYFVPPGEMLRAAVPSRLLAAGDAVYVPGARAIGEVPRDPRQKEILEAVMSRGRARLTELVDDLGRRGLGAGLRSLAAAGVLRIPGETVRVGRALLERAFVAVPQD